MELSCLNPLLFFGLCQHLFIVLLDRQIKRSPQQQLLANAVQKTLIDPSPGIGFARFTNQLNLDLQKNGLICGRTKLKIHFLVDSEIKRSQPDTGLHMKAGIILTRFLGAVIRVIGNPGSRLAAKAKIDFTG